jgi:N-acetylmuramoyl-L-alanine amidase
MESQLQAELETERKKNQQIITLLNETITKSESKDKTIAALRTRIEEDRKSKENVLVQTALNTGGSGKGNKQEIIFKVQILTAKVSLAKNSPRFKGLKNVWEYKHGGRYKYTTGYKRDLQSAIALQSELRKRGFNDAFVAAFQNGKRIPVKFVLDTYKMRENYKTKTSIDAIVLKQNENT